MSIITQTKIAKFQDRVVQTELDERIFGLNQMFLDSTPKNKILTPSMVAELQKKQTRTITYPALKEDVITSTAVESFTIPSNISDAEEITITSISIFSGYKIFPAMFIDNAISREDYEMNKLEEVFKAMANAKEVQQLAFLETQKTQVWTNLTSINNGAGSYSFNSTTDLLEVDLAGQKNGFFNRLKTSFRNNDQSRMGSYSLVTNEGGLTLALDTIATLGQANASNEQNATNSIPKAYGSQNISGGSDQFIGFMIEDGAVGIAQNFPWEFRSEIATSDAQWGVSDTAVPMLGNRINTYYNKGKADASAEGGTLAESRMTTFEEFGFLDKFYLVSSYNSDLATRANNILKIKGATS